MSTSRPNLQGVTNGGAPYWTGAPAPTVPGNPVTGVQARQNGSTIASVVPGIRQINVAQPDLYTKPVAAHESTHIFQGTRNSDFQRGTMSQLPAGDPSAGTYDYGGIPGLKANPQRSIGQYNPEQQAQMVEDLTKAQNSLPAKMTAPQLAAWDDTKATLERPIRQLMAVPARDESIAGKIDDYIADRPIGKYLDHPASRLMGLIRTPALQAQPQPAPSAPSVALGYPSKSKLVR